MSNLSAALQARARRTGSPADLDAAVAAGRQAGAAAPEGHPLYAANQSNLAGALRAVTSTGANLGTSAPPLKRRDARWPRRPGQGRTGAAT